MSFNRALFLGVAVLASFGVAQAQDSASETAPSEAAAPVEPAPAVSLHTATVGQLASLDHVDVDTAEAIVALRESRQGRLGTVEELRVIPGIEAATLDSLREGTTMEFELPVGARKTYSSVDEVLAEFGHEPTVQQVQQWATDYARLNPGMVDRWFASSQTFAVLPELQLEYRFEEGWDQDFIYYPVDINDPHGQLSSDLDDAGKDQDQKFKVRATWDLDKLVMSSERIRIINEAQDIVKLRDKVLTEVTRLYFERRRVQVELLLKPPSDMHSLAKEHLRLMELTANIDALTGGALSQALLRTQ
jgi:hypothetical protein